MKRGPQFKTGQLLDGVHELIKPLGTGQDGEVWCAKNKQLGKIVAIKLLNTIKDEDKRRRFENEIEILIPLNHPHIINVFAKGEAWNPTTGEQVPFYVMEYIDALPLSARLKTIPEKDVLITFCTLFDQAADALVTVHNKGITHGDIKSANLLVYKSNVILKLTDFGFGIPPGKTVSKRKKYPDSSYPAPEGFSAEEADIYKMGRTFQDCLKEAEEKMTKIEMVALLDLGEALVNDPTNFSLRNFQRRLENIKELHYTKGIIYYSEVRSLVPEVAGTQPSKLIRITTQGDINLSERAIAIIDLPHFQKLRWIRELTPADFVFPSATHTFFEAALGQYGMVIKYLNILGSIPRFRDIIDPLQMRTAIILSLLREVGQYPFSSQIYRATRSKEYDPRFRSALIVTKEPYSTVLSKNWDLDPDMVASLLTDARSKASVKQWRLILSVLDGPVSALAVEFLIRTASSTGLQITIDVDRLLHNLCLSIEEDQIAIRLQGLTALESFCMSRYMITERMFYHHKLVAIDRMLVQAFREMHQSGIDFEQLFEVGEWEFIRACIGEARSRGLSRAESLLTSWSDRNIRKRVATWLYGELKIPDSFENMSFSIRLEEEFSQLLGERLIPGSIVFDSPPQLIYTFSVPVITESGQVSATDVSPTIRAMLNTLQEIAATRRLFASQEVVDRLQKLGREKITEVIISIASKQKDVQLNENRKESNP